MRQALIPQTGRAGTGLIPFVLVLGACTDEPERVPSPRVEASSSKTSPAKADAPKLHEAWAKEPKDAFSLQLRSMRGAPDAKDGVGVYAAAKRALDRDDPLKALETIGSAKDDLLRDRLAVLEGNAYRSLGRFDSAKRSYMEAIERAQVSSVVRGAARGLVNVLAELGQREGQLFYLEVLLSEPNAARRNELLLQRAKVLSQLGRDDEAAQEAWSIVESYQSKDLVQGAQEILEELRQRGKTVPGSPTELELARIRQLIRLGVDRRARALLSELEAGSPQSALDVALTRAKIYERSGASLAERKQLLDAYQRFPTRRSAELLWRLGYLSMRSDDYPQAEKYFTELGESFPSSPLALQGEFFTAWFPYDLGEFDRAHQRMLAFLERRPNAERRPSALWFAGWSAYLADKDDEARGLLTKFAAETGDDLKTEAQAHYWLGRIAQRKGETSAAREEYSRVLKLAPLSYYGFLTRARLEEIGAPVPVRAPTHPAKRAALRAAPKLLGEDRPASADRAIALFEVGFREQALEELEALAASYRSAHDLHGLGVVVDLMKALRAEDLAFRVATAAVDEGGDLLSSSLYAWHTWEEAYPQPFKREIRRAEKAHGLDARLILSVIRTESLFRPNARSPAGARGLMQIMPRTALLIGKTAKGGRHHLRRQRRPESNIWMGTWYLARLLERYPEQMAAAIGAYNAGPRAMDGWIEAHRGADLDVFVEQIPYEETRAYVRRVLETYMVYSLMEGLPLPELNLKVDPPPPPEGAVRF